MSERVLTGVKPTGFLHIGNYVGAIRPALEREAHSANSFFFIADYHALNQIQNAKEFNLLSYAVAASWLACGLDPSRSLFYRQSDVSEVFELTTILAAFTPKGWMNKAHAYKAAVAENIEADRDRDADINMGLYTYPLLMAADILIFDATLVPVGRDQVQHVEIARDIALRVNSHYGEDVFILPECEIQGDAEAIPGLDGRKMSKSYGNTIPLFASREEWRSRVYGIKTDSSGRYEKKKAEGSAVFDIFAALADPVSTEALRSDLEHGRAGWGDAKAKLLACIEERLTEPTERFNHLMANPTELEDVLRSGAQRARRIAQTTLERVRSAIGRSGSVQLIGGADESPVPRH
jgi:tryptophanyl-tRNA synthetase